MNELIPVWVEELEKIEKKAKEKEGGSYGEEQVSLP